MQDEVRGLGTLQGELIASYTDRLAQYINSKPYIIACLLDINVKGCVFNREQRALKWEMLTVAVAQHITNTRPDVPAPGIADNVIGLARRVPGERDVNFLQNLLEDNREEDEHIPNPLADARLEAEREIAMYRSYPQDATLSTDAREWWTTKHHMPNLRFFARKYLPFPVGEGDCERIFSKTGLIYCPRRKRLLPLNCKMMLVTNSALRAFGFTLDGDVKLTLPEFIVHERDIVGGSAENDSDTDLNL